MQKEKNANQGAVKGENSWAPGHWCCGSWRGREGSHPLGWEVKSELGCLRGGLESPHVKKCLRFADPRKLLRFGFFLPLYTKGNL